MQRPEVGSREVCGRSSKEAIVAGASGFGGEGQAEERMGNCCGVCLFLLSRKGTGDLSMADGTWGGGLLFR